jgi:hypothetical protein
MMISIAPMSPSRRRLARMSASRSVERRCITRKRTTSAAPGAPAGGAQQTEGQPKPVETGGPAPVQSVHVVHGDDRVPADPRPVLALERDRLFPAQDIDRIILLQVADQREILDQNLMRRRVPARIDDKDVKARCGGRLVRLAARRLPGLGLRLDDVAFMRHGRNWRSRRQPQAAAVTSVLGELSVSRLHRRLSLHSLNA